MPNVRPKLSAATGWKKKVLTTRNQGCKAEALSSNRLEEQGLHHKGKKALRPKPSAATGWKNKVLTTGGKGCKAKAFSSNRLEEKGPHHKKPSM